MLAVLSVADVATLGRVGGLVAGQVLVEHQAGLGGAAQLDATRAHVEPVGRGAVGVGDVARPPSSSGRTAPRPGSSRAGRVGLSSASAPAVCGLAIEVPEMKCHSTLLSVPAAARMSTPGAETDGLIEDTAPVGTAAGERGHDVAVRVLDVGHRAGQGGLRARVGGHERLERDAVGVGDVRGREGVRVTVERVAAGLRRWPGSCPRRRARRRSRPSRRGRCRRGRR